MVLVTIIPTALQAATYLVGPTRPYQQLQQVAGLLNPGDVVEVDGDHTYPGEVVFTRPGSPTAKIHIRGVRVNGKRPVISGGANAVAFTTPWPYNGPNAGHHYVFEGFEVVNATNRGIFHQAKDLTIRDCLIRSNRNGILGADEGSGSLLLEYTELSGNGEGDRAHQIYMATDEVNHPGSVFRMQHCLVRDGRGGNNVKSRAERNEIYYNRIEGAFYHELELIGPDGDADQGNWSLKREDSDVVGNVLIKRETTFGNDPNFYVIRIGGDGTGATRGRYRFLNNTILSGTRSVFRLFDELESVEIQNNVFHNPGGTLSFMRTLDATWITGQPVIAGRANWMKTGATDVPAQLTETLFGTDPGLVAIVSGNLFPTETSPLVNAGRLPSTAAPGFDFPSPLAAPIRLPPDATPDPAGGARHREDDGAIDIGAFEYPLAEPGGGSLAVEIQPDAVRAAGARWRRVGETQWYQGGETEAGVPPGTHRIEFSSVDGWTPPARPQIAIAGTPVPRVTGHYAQVRRAILHVDDSNATGNETGTSQYPFRTVQGAVSAAVSGDTLKVAIGSYGAVQTAGKSLTILGGYPGAETSDYAAGRGGAFAVRDLDPASTRISGGAGAAGVTFTRFNANPYHGRLDNLRVTQSRKGVVCDTQVSWPHPDDLILTNLLVDQNGQVGDVTRGAGILVCGNRMQILDSQIRANHGGRGAGISGSVQGLLVQDSRIEDNICYDDHGGGVYLAGTSQLVRNRISGNRVELGYGWGGGLLVFNAGSSAVLEQNLIRANHAPTYGGGVFVDEGAAMQMQNDLVVYNTTEDGIGAGVALDDGDPGPSHLDMRNCTVAYNNAAVSGDPYSRGGNGIFVDQGSFADIRDSLFWGNGGDDFYVRDGSDLTLTWSLSQETWPGVGNLTANPWFADPAAEDFHLRSQIGRYLPSVGSWVMDTQHSPAIDAGDPTSPFGAEPPPNGGRVNIGAFGNTPEASLGGVPAAVPDFVVTAILLTPANPSPGSSFTAAVRVRNQGAGSGLPGTLQVWTDRAGVAACGATGDGSAVLGSLGAGAERTVTLSGLMAPAEGTRTFRVFIDSACATEESDEGNNQTTQPYQVVVPSAPDFVVTNLVLTPASPKATQTFSAAVTVRNQGSGAGVPQQLQVWTEQSGIPSCGALGDAAKTLVSLAAGASRTLTFTGLRASSAGTRTFMAFVDAGCQTAESNETNNQLAYSYQVLPAPASDFTITQILLTPESPRANRTFRARVTVKNQGTVGAQPGLLQVWVHQPGSQTCGAAGDKSLSVSRLAPGASRTLTFTGLAAGSAASKTFRAFIDARCIAAESDEANNQATRAYQVIPR
jgi:hypothetical protein